MQESSLSSSSVFVRAKRENYEYRYNVVMRSLLTIPLLQCVTIIFVAAVSDMDIQSPQTSFLLSTCLGHTARHIATYATCT